MVHLVDLAMAILMIEAALLLALRDRHGLARRDILLIALAGLGLLAALRGALSGAGPWPIVLGLSLGGLAHGADLWLRLKARPGPDQKR
jgi:hypothetical protein